MIFLFLPCVLTVDYCVYHYKSTELVSFIYIVYWTLNKYYYYYNSQNPNEAEKNIVPHSHVPYT